MNDKVVSSEQFCFFTQPRLVFGSFEKVLLKDIILCFLYCTSLSGIELIFMIL